MMTNGDRKVLLLSVGYGKGHHSAAYSLAQCYDGRGWRTRVVDVCELAQPRLFRLTQLFYSFCVRKAPWLWGVTYSMTDTADWRQLVTTPLFRSVLNVLESELNAWSPDLVICTYPLFAYMLDELRRNDDRRVPYAVVVTDAREISRPWMLCSADLFLLPDEGSMHMVMDRYGIPAERVLASGFPVGGEFAPDLRRGKPGSTCLNVLYGAYRQYGGVEDDIAALLGSFPQVRLTVLGGMHTRRLKRRFARDCEMGQLRVLSETQKMAELLRQCHLYIGKAGAATVFECYASEVPVLVNFTLPGQELGNLELLLEDGAGRHVETTAHLIETIKNLLDDDAAGWCDLHAAMRNADRRCGAARICNSIDSRLLR